ncbi:L,D-transpeptidase [Tropicimonas marinistellae]|uniref:L,D-transpeptidase n=1 Tax=Tropicimonas marinistellae TaxID=1739787 RepID=UPI0008336416|nr:L,D-transpeptidase [Tropicimonas marinistellae]
MFTRRTFLATAIASSAVPALSQTPAPAPAPAAQPFSLDPRFEPQFVKIKKQFLPGQLLILPRSHYLYFVTEPGNAIRYGVGVGKAGLEFTGTATIDVKKEWPTWRPTQEMIERDPATYSKFVNNDYVMPGGPGNPLGARALYLFQDGRDTFFRIHGTTEPQSIGRSVSNGCIRMINGHVIDLYERVPIGTIVTVL